MSKFYLQCNSQDGAGYDKIFEKPLESDSDEKEENKCASDAG